MAILRALDAARTQISAGLRLAALLRHPITSSAGVEEMLRDRLARRAQNFLWSVEHLIFTNPNSPYRPLLELAGYDLPKVRQLVAARGLDGALDQLQQDGVYVRIQEFKGTEPALRHGRTFQFQERDFANPSVRAIFRTRSGGSRSRGTQTEISTDDLLDHTRLLRWLVDHYGLGDRDIIWRGGQLLPIAFSLMGRPPLKCFSPVEHLGRANPFLLTVARLASGVPVPRTEVVASARVTHVARYINRVNTSRGMVVGGFPNSALRLVLAAEEAGIDLGDVVFIVGGEPLTPAKRRQIEERGFRVLSAFAFSEFGPSAWSCSQGREVDDLHVLSDRAAVRQYPRIVDHDGATVPAYLFTSLLPHAPYVMLNMECGDYGGLEERSCGCFMDRVGLRLHMHTIRSFEKLTAEGITFIGPSLITLLEEVLPRRFGGDSRHYQLVEGEDGQGFTRLYLLISPHLGPLNEEAVREVVLRELGGLHIKPEYGSRIVGQVWRDAETIRVLRRDPLPTMAGKILHLHRDRGMLQAGRDSQDEGGNRS